MNKWLRRFGEDPAEEKADVPSGPDIGVAPLDKLDEDRAPAPAAPGGLPGEQRPMSAQEVMTQLESAGKSLYDSGLDIEKAIASISKIRSMSGATDADRIVLEKSAALLKDLHSLKGHASKAANDVVSYRESLSPKTSSWSSWL